MRTSSLPQVDSTTRRRRRYRGPLASIAVAVAFGAGMLGAGPASANATNVTQITGSGGNMNCETPGSGVTCSAAVSGANFTVTAGDFIVASAGTAFLNAATQHVAISDSQGNTYTNLYSAGVPGLQTGESSDMRVAKASATGTLHLIFNVPASSTGASGGVVGTFRSAGATHGLAVDVSGTTTWNYSLSGTSNSVSVNVGAVTTKASDFVVSGGYIRQRALGGTAIAVTGGQPTLTYSGFINSSGVAAGTHWSDYNIGVGTTNWAIGSAPNGTYTFTAGVTPAKNTVGSAGIVALYAN